MTQPPAASRPSPPNSPLKRLHRPGTHGDPGGPAAPPADKRTRWSWAIGAGWLLAIALTASLGRPLPSFAGSSDGGGGGAPTRPQTLLSPPSGVTVSIQGQDYPVAISATTAEGAAYTGGWSSQSITVSWHCAMDAGAKRDAWQQAVLDQDGANQSVPVSCTDTDGYTGSTDVGGFSIDKAPSVTCSAVPATIWPADGRAVPVTVTVSLMDALSGPASFTPLSSTASGEPGDLQGFGMSQSGPDTQIQAPALSDDARAGSSRGTVLAKQGESYVFTYQGSNRASGTANCSAVVSVQPAPTALDGADRSANAWSYGASLPTPRGRLAAAKGPDGRIYAIGGDSGEGPVADVEVYDPASNAWTAVAPLPTAREALAAATGSDGRIYAIGGDDTGSEAVGTVEFYDPATNTWTAAAPLPTPRRNLAAVAGRDGRIYAIGGAVLQKDPYSANAYEWTPSHVVEAYDPTTNTWAAVAPLPTPTTRLGAATGNDGRIYTVAGQTCEIGVLFETLCGPGPGPAASLEIYDPATDTWTAGPDRPEALEQVAVATGSDGPIYAVGGYRSAFPGPAGPRDAVDAYDPQQGKWSSIGPLPAPRIAQATVVGNDGRLYVFGGENEPGAGATLGVPTLQIYDPARNSGAP